MQRFTTFILASILGVSTVCGTQVENTLSFADGLYRRGLHTQASTEYETWLSRNTTANEMRADVQFRLADCYEQMGQLDKAGSLYATVSTTTTGERRAAALLKSAALHLKANEADKALPALEALVTTPPESKELQDAALYRLGMCYEALGRATEARQTYQSLTQRDGAYHDFSRLRLAALTALQGDNNAALALYKSIAESAKETNHRSEAALVGGALAYKMGDYGTASTLYGILDEATLGQQNALQSAAWASLRAGQLEKARAYLAADRLRTPEESDTRLFLAGSISSALGANAEAEKAYTELLQQYPTSEYAAAAAYETLLMTYKKGDAQQFLDAYKTVAASLPKEADAKLQPLRLEAAVQVRDITQARSATAAIVRTRNNAQMADAIYRLAWLEQHLENWHAAGEYYLKVATTWPNATCAAQAAYAAAYAFRRGNKPDRAAQALSAALASGDPKIVPQALMLRARDELAERNMTAAAATLDEYINRFPDAEGIDEARYLRGLIFFNAKDWVAAEPLLKHAAQSPKLPHARKVDAAMRQAQSLHAVGRMEEAAAVLQPLIGLNDTATLDAAYLNWLVEFQLGRKAYPEATQAAKQLLAQSATPADRVLSNVLLGRIAEAQNQDATALAAYSTALSCATEPTIYDVQAALGEGRLLLKQGDSLKAADAFRRAVKCKGANTPENRRAQAEAYLGLGRATRQDEPDTALRAFMNLIIFFNDATMVPEAFAGAIEILTNKGRTVEAGNLKKEWQMRYPETFKE